MSFRVLNPDGTLVQEVQTPVTRVTGGSEVHIVEVNSDKEMLVHDPSVIEALSSLGITVLNCNIVRTAEFSISGKVETDVAGVTYTVPAMKTFYFVAFSGSCDSPAPMGLRLKVDNVTKKRISLGAANGGTTAQIISPIPAIMATAGQVIKATYDAQFNKGIGWVEFVGVER